MLGCTTCPRISIFYYVTKPSKEAQNSDSDSFGTSTNRQCDAHHSVGPLEMELELDPDTGNGTYLRNANLSQEATAPQRTFPELMARPDNFAPQWTIVQSKLAQSSHQTASQDDGPGYAISPGPVRQQALDFVDAALAFKEIYMTSVEPREHKRLRCGLCSGCARQDCGVCINCKDKPKFNGPGASAALASPISELDCLKGYHALT